MSLREFSREIKQNLNFMKPISRRKFVKDSIKVTAAASFLAPLASNASSLEDSAPYLFTQVTLPYAFNALEPNIDAMTMEIHYTKHHATYIKNVNEEIAAGKFFYETEKDFFMNASKLSAKAKNNSGGAWNHNFFWQIMKPNGGGAPSGKISEAINGPTNAIAKLVETEQDNRRLVNDVFLRVVNRPATAASCSSASGSRSVIAIATKEPSGRKNMNRRCRYAAAEPIRTLRMRCRSWPRIWLSLSQAPTFRSVAAM